MRPKYRFLIGNAVLVLSPLAILVPLLLFGCSGANKEVYVEKPVDELYNTGMDEMTEERYSAAAKSFAQVEGQHPYSSWATKAQLMGAYASYEAGDYGEAIIALDRFILLHPGNKDIAYAYYLKAMCYYMQIVDVGRDQKNAELAHKALEEVVVRQAKLARSSRCKSGPGRE